MRFRRVVGMTFGTEAGTPSQVVKFTFFRLSPGFRNLPPEAKADACHAFARVVEKAPEDVIVGSYSTVGTRGDCDLLLWVIGAGVEDIQSFHAALNATPLAGHLSVAHSFLSVTRRSQYVKAHARADPSGHGSVRTVVPGRGKFLFVYPFWKTAEWYQLAKETRQEMMNEHFKIGHRYPEIKIHTTYSFGLDDPEFVLAFESDDASRFVDLVVELRETKARPYTLRDTPVFTCVRGEIRDILKQLG